MRTPAHPAAEAGCASCPVGPAHATGPARSTDPAGHGSPAGTPSRRLLRLGLSTGPADVLLALAGNPNTGKSTLFNALTGLRQHVGNWAGKTVSRAEGAFSYAGRRYRLVDLPGTYSLLSAGTDEEVARDFLVFGRPDVTVVVVDAGRLERNLNLALQVLEITDRVVVALNLVDEARRHGLRLDDRRLARELGVPVVPTAARRGEGIDALLAAVHEVASAPPADRAARPGRRDGPGRLRNGTGPREVTAAVRTLEAQLEQLYPDLPHRRWVALRLLEGDPSIERAVLDGTLSALTTRADQMDGVA